jgi:hypothetical protein
VVNWRLTGNANTNPSTNFVGTTDARPLVIRTGGAEAIRIDTALRTGIGTSTPQVKLHVKGDRIRLESADGTRVLDLRADGAALDLQSSGAPLFINNTNQPTFINPGGGNVGVGTTAPRTQLHVLGRISTGADFTSAGAVTLFPPDGFAWFHLDNGPAGGRPIGRLRISHGNNPGDNEILCVLQNGDMGIGTSAPAARLEVTTNAAADCIHGINNSDTGAAVRGQNRGIQGTGVLGQSGIPGLGLIGTGVRGESQNGHGVQGDSRSHVGTEGTTRTGTGVFGESINGIGVLGAAPNGIFSGLFTGRVRVVGFLEKAGGGFKIDHPLDASNKYLNHSFVESSTMKNLYDGVATLDSDGAATVELPEWCDALNTDFRYQLTPVGGPAPDLHVAQEISSNRFGIAGGPPGAKVCWQVTGVRKDLWAQANPLVVEEEKADAERGSFLHPELHDQPEDRSFMQALFPEMTRRMRDQRARRMAADG